jgi:hypothetical protein
MKTRALGIFLCLAVVGIVLAADPHFTPSKITYAKKNSWEALASKWMSSNDLRGYVEDQKNENKQMIFVDYNGAQYRGLFSDKIKYKGWYYVEVFTESEMAKEITYYKKRGFEPSYIYKNAGGYTCVFVTPEQVGEARKLLNDLGIGTPTVKE